MLRAEGGALNLELVRSTLALLEAALDRADMRPTFETALGEAMPDG